MTKRIPPLAELFIATARKYLGYESELLGRNKFGLTVGYDSVPWSGSFIDVVAREAGVQLPSFTYVPSALAECIRLGLVTKNPRPGDIAIFNFPSSSGHAASAFSMPTAGIVTDVRELRSNGRFLSIEGNSTGQTSYQDKDGVHQRIRHVTDVVIFCRPAEFVGSASAARIRQLITKLRKKLTAVLNQDSKLELAAIEEAVSAQGVVRLRMLHVGTRNKSIELIQLALSQVTDIQGAERGKWDAATSSAFARFQRNIGRVGSDAAGVPDLPTLNRLSKETGLFKLDD